MRFTNTLVLDIETDGLASTKIHCVCVNGEVFYDADSFNTFLSGFCGNTYSVVGHNITSFDRPVLERLYGTCFDRFNVVDTLVLSRLSNPSRDGGHSLRNWGERLGFPKGDHTDWANLTPEMVDYCKQDVAVTTKVLETLEKELEGFSDESIELEHEVHRIINQQRVNGWKLSERRCIDLLSELKERKYALEDEIRTVFKPLPVAGREVTPKYKKDGTLSVVGLSAFGSDMGNVCGRFIGVTYPEFNVGSRQQIGRYLKHFGWEPNKFTETGQPIVDESVLNEVEGIPQAKLIAEYLMLQKRVAQVQSWLDAVEDDGRVHGYVNSNGAVTGRMTHSKPNVAQVPATGAPYGEECRACWIAEEGYSIVGADASGLELRMLAHYMNDEGYTNEILTGDVHTANQLAAGLDTRPQAKTFIYAFLYGAGDAKIGSIVGGSAKEGAMLKAKFLANTPALAMLRDQVAKKAKQGYLLGLDGRKVYVRSEHAALNTLLQSAGAIVMKKALCLLEEYATIWGIDYKIIGNIHDEIQAEVVKGKEDVFGRLTVSCIEAAGNHFNLRCPLAGEYKVGESWAQTH